MFLVLLGMGFLVFDSFFFCGFGCDRGLWLKWRFVGCVGGGLVAVAVVVVACVGSCGCVGLWLWLCWWWFDFFFFFLAVGCGGHIEVVLVGGCSWPAVVVKCGDDPFVGFFLINYFIVVEILFYCNDYIILL